MGGLVITEIRQILMNSSQINGLSCYLDMLKEIYEGLVYEDGNQHSHNIQLLTTLKMITNNASQTFHGNDKRKCRIWLNKTQVELLFYYLDLLEQTLCFLDPKTTKQGDVIAHHLHKIIIMKDVINEFYAEDLADL